MARFRDYRTGQVAIGKNTRIDLGVKERIGQLSKVVFANDPDSERPSDKAIIELFYQFLQTEPFNSLFQDPDARFIEDGEPRDSPIPGAVRLAIMDYNEYQATDRQKETINELITLFRRIKRAGRTVVVRSPNREGDELVMGAEYK